MDNTKKRYNELIKVINYHRDLYYNKDDPEISDYEFDMLMQELKQIEAQHPEFIKPDSPTQLVGGNTGKSTFEKVTHDVPMLSLQDVFSTEDVEGFLKDFDDDTIFSVEEKIDGLSMSVTYRDGQLVRAETRGDGYIGEDITENAKYIRGIPLTINCDVLTELEIRCEVYLPINDFIRLNKIRESNGLPLYKNPRNAAAGLLRNHDINEIKSSGLSAFTFNVQQYKWNAEALDYN